MRLSVVVLAGLFVSGAWAQKVKIIFESDGTRVLWVAAKPGAPPAGALTTTKTELEYDFGSAKDSDSIYIWNRSTNNMATEMVESILQEASWSVGADAETLIGEVKIKLEHKGQPLAAGSVTVTYGKEKRELMLTPSAGGSVSVFGVSPGPLKVTARVPVNGQPKAYPAQTWEMTLARTQPMPILTVVIPDAVETVTAPATTTAKPDKAAPPAPGTKETATSPARKDDGPLVPPGKDVTPTGGGSPILSIFFALLAIAGLGFLVRYLMNNKSDEMAAGLKKLGVPVPDDVQKLDDPDPVVPKAPQPVPQILLDSADPDPVSAVPSPIVLGTTALTKLVSPDGNSFMVAEGTSTIGRDASAEIALVGQDSVSRSHARLSNHNGEVTIEDLGSTNGTYVNGRKLNPGEAVPVKLGDTIQLGTTTLRGE